MVSWSKISHQYFLVPNQHIYYKTILKSAGISDLQDIHIPLTKLYKREYNLTVCFLTDGVNNSWRYYKAIQHLLLYYYVIPTTELYHECCLGFSNNYFDEIVVIIQGSFT